MFTTDAALDWNRDGGDGPTEGLVGVRSELTRDVMINVVANLIAGAITAALIYVLGALSGLFPLNKVAFAGAIFTIAAAGGFFIPFMPFGGWFHGSLQP